MILLCGEIEDASLRLVAERLNEIRARFVVVNHDELAAGRLELKFESDETRGWLTTKHRVVPLHDVASVFTRLDGDSRRGRSQPVIAAFIAWLEICSASVINIYSAMGSNMSKPYQLQAIQRAGFSVPETIITNEPLLVRQFLRHYGTVVYKSISATRSIVSLVEEDDLSRLDSILWCPTQFQEFVEVRNVRVHVIGDCVYATEIATNVVDYRYAYAQGGTAELSATDLPSSLSRKCVALSRGLGLKLAGIDLILTSTGSAYCLEVNPSPAFSYYELRSGQPISAAIAQFLAESDEVGLSC